MAGTSKTKRAPGKKGEGEAGKGPTGIVGIGVCLASLSSIETLFDSLTEDLSASYIIAVRQQDGLTTGAVLDVLKKRTELPATIAKHGEPLKPTTSM